MNAERIRSASMHARFVAKVGTLPGIPAIVSRLSRVIADDRSSAADVAQVLRTDPGLTGNLLRVVNSPIYRGRYTIVSVHDAVARLGMRHVYELASGAWLRRSLPANLSLYGTRPDVFWLHSLGTAVFSDHISSIASTGVHAQTAFTAGLLHHMGKLVIAVVLAEDNVHIPTVGIGEPLIEQERLLLGTDHTLVGFEVANRWCLPAEIAAAIRWHHDPLEAPESQRAFASLIHIASAMAYAMGLGVDPTGRNREVLPAALEAISIDAAAVQVVVDQALPEVQKMMSALAVGGID